MSKDRIPEVGDLWINTENKEKFVILDYIPIGRDFIGFNQQTKNIRLFDALDDMPKQYKYLGHSKANIDDLFKTENDFGYLKRKIIKDYGEMELKQDD